MPRARRILDPKELVSGPWRVTTVRTTRAGVDREYLRVTMGRYHVADVRIVKERINVLTRYGVDLADRVENDQAGPC